MVGYSTLFKIIWIKSF